MIEELQIANFRAISKPVTIRLRPITILIGKNSAGKSTVLKFLLMVRQTLENAGRGLAPEFFVSDGAHVRLGGLRNLQNRNPGFTGKRLRFRIRLHSPGPSAQMLQMVQAFGRQQADAHNGNGAAPADLDWVSNVSKGELDFDILGEVMYRKPEVGRHVVKGSQGGRQVFEFKSQGLKDVRFLSFPSTTTRPEGAVRSIAWNTFLRPPLEVLEETRHLSALRQESQRIIVLGSPPPDDVGDDGRYAVQHLYDILNREGRKAEFLYESIRNIARIDDLQFKARAREFQKHFQGRNMDTGARCHLSDFGVGVSQCIPIFVQGALLQKGQLLMVEQPEAQLHPTAQLGLGTFFADLWTRFGVPALVETHSDNLVLRIRKLVAKGKLLPDDVSIAYFSVENRTLAIKNLDIAEDGSVRDLPMEFFGADLLEALDMDSTPQA